MILYTIEEYQRLEEDMFDAELDNKEIESKLFSDGTVVF